MIFIVVLCLLLSACAKNPAEYIHAGNESFDAQRYADAELQYRKAIQIDSQAGEAHFGLAKALLQLQKAPEAYASLKRATELDPNNEAARNLLTNLALRSYLSDVRRPNELYTLLQNLSKAALASNPKSFEGWRVAGFLARTDRKDVEAIEAFKKALAAKPSDPEVSLALAEILLDSKSTAAEGERTLLELVSAHPDEAAGYDALYKVYLAGNRDGEAEQILRRKIGANPAKGNYLTQLAGFYNARGKKAAAEEILKTLATDSQKYPQGKLLLGEYYLQVEQPAKALEEFQAGWKQGGPDRVQYGKRMLGLLNSMGRVDEAKRIADETLAQDPKNVELRTARALLDLEQRNVDSAIGALRSLAAEQPQSAAIQYHLGRALKLKGDLEGAKLAWLEATKLNSRFLEPRVAIAEVLVETGKVAEASKVIESVLQISPSYQPAQLLRLQALAAEGRIDEARNSINQLRERYPDSALLDVEQGFLSLREKKFGESANLIRKGYVPGQANIRPLMGLTQALIGAQQYPDAIRTLEADLAKNPDRPQVKYMLAEAYLAGGQPGNALPVLSQLHRSHPGFIPAGLMLADIQSRLGDSAQAVAVLNGMRKASPTNVAPLVVLAQVQQRAGLWGEAKQSFREILKIDPNSIFGLNGLANLIAEQSDDGELQEGLRLALSANRLVPADRNVQDTLAYLQLRMNQNSQAMPVLRELAKKDPANPLFRFHYGLALQKTGDSQGAKLEFAAALRSKPDPRLAEKINSASAR